MMPQIPQFQYCCRADSLKLWVNGCAALEQQIKNIEASEEVAPPGCHLARYQARGQYKAYWYYYSRTTSSFVPPYVGCHSAYGNNTSFLKELEKRGLNYIGVIAKNRNILFKDSDGNTDTIRIVHTYGQRNWVEVFYREAKGWLGLSEYQVREKRV